MNTGGVPVDLPSGVPVDLPRLGALLTLGARLALRAGGVLGLLAAGDLLGLLRGLA